MSPRIILLLTLHYAADNTLLRVVLDIDDMNKVPDDVLRYPLEPENREYLAKLLPEHIRSIGPIVEVDASLFDVVKAAL